MVRGLKEGVEVMLAWMACAVFYVVIPWAITYFFVYGTWSAITTWWHYF